MLKPKLFLFLFAFLFSSLSFAAQEGIPASGRTFSYVDATILMFGAALVFMMQAGFAFLEAGNTRAKNSVNVLLKNYLDVCLGAIGYWAIGYGLMFGNNLTGWFGESMYLFQPVLNGDYMFFFFQAMFGATAATIVSGAIAERASYRGYLIGSVLISSFIYPIFGSWAWGGWHGGSGWLVTAGFIDFAGSTVVHVVGGLCALAALIVVGPRKGRFTITGETSEIPGHNIGYATLGAFLLWFGWFGFNGASIAVAGTDETIGRILTNTFLAGCAGAIGAIFFMMLDGQKTMLNVVLNGSLAGLVAITAGCQVMDPQWAIATGFIAGILVRISELVLLHAFKLDDVVGAVSVHGVCGIFGTMAAGMFHRDAFMSMDKIMTQGLGVGAAILFVLPTAYIMYKLIDIVIGMRVPEIDEQRGLDISEHAEVGYPEFQTIFKGDRE